VGYEVPIASHHSAQIINLNEILTRCKPDFQRIEQSMKSHFSSHLPFVNEVSGYILFSGGKRFRPLLTVYAARICGRDDPGDNEVYDLSVVPEYLHAASLLHDDVVDEGILRRGRPPAYKVWGNKAAVLVGDYLYARAIDLASSFGNVKIAQAIAKTVALMAEGEVIQLLEAKTPSYKERSYMEVIDRKTASLISVSCRIGALLAGASQDNVERLAEFGRYLGRAFQIIDDVLDYTADVKELGKGLGTDLAEGKVTLPLIVALEKAAPKDKNRLKGILENKNADYRDLSWILELLEQTGGIEYARAKALSFIGQAVERIQPFKQGPAKSLLEDLSWFVAYRKK